VSVRGAREGKDKLTCWAESHVELPDHHTLSHMFREHYETEQDLRNVRRTMPYNLGDAVLLLQDQNTADVMAKFVDKAKYEFIQQVHHP